MSALLIVACVAVVTLVWTACGVGTVWFAARFAGSDTALLNFVIWPIALMGSLCILANEKARIGLLSELSERGLRARARARNREGNT